MTFVERIGGRKFALAALSLLSAHLLTWQSLIGDGVYSAVIIATVGAYMAGNVGARVASRDPKEPTA